MPNKRERRRAAAQQRSYETRLQKDTQEAISDRPVFVSPYLVVPEFLVKNFRGLLSELAEDSIRLQPLRSGEFSQRAAALHEASHCVVTASEGYALKTVAISQQGGVWLGEFWRDADSDIVGFEFAPGTDHEEFLANLRIVLAGRRGELLFTEPFCLRAGLDELAYALLMVMIPLGLEKSEHEAREHYEVFWPSLLTEVDETLLAHRDVVHTIADQLMLRGRLNREELTAAVAGISKRNAPLKLRTPDQLAGLKREKRPMNRLTIVIREYNGVDERPR